MTAWNLLFNETELSNLRTAAAEPSAKGAPMLGHSLLCIQGPDAFKFLQGQVTCDLNQLTQENWLRGAQCTPKGRVILSFTAFAPNKEQVQLRIPSDLAAQASTNLKKYMVFSKATLTDLSERYCGFYLHGNDTAAAFAKLLEFEITEKSCTHADGIVMVNIRPQEWECWIAIEKLQPLWPKLKTQYTWGSSAMVSLASIQAGEPDISPETYETFTPHSLNYPLTNAVNFKKGCYTGQEIVARMHYRGQLKKHAYRFEVDLPLNQLPPKGSALQNDQGSNLGEYIDGAAKNATQSELLVYLGDAERDQLYWAGQKLRELPLPYAIPVTQE